MFEKHLVAGKGERKKNGEEKKRERTKTSRIKETNGGNERKNSK